MIYIYSRRGHEKWITSFINHYYQKKSIKISIFNEINTENFKYYQLFSNYLNSPNLKSLFSENEINEIILRCRLLRSLPYKCALKMLLACEYVVRDFIETKKPSIFIGPRIDSYVLDILERLLTKNGILYIGLWRSAFFDGKFFITKRGEIEYLNNSIKNSEFVNLITKLSSNNFTATSIGSYSNLTNLAIIKKFIYLYLRDIFLETVRNLGYFKFGYREMTNRFNVKDSSPKILSFLPPKVNITKLKHFIDLNDRKKVFIALQVNPESTIDYYSSNVDFINIDYQLKKIVNKFTSFGYLVFIKDHPNMIGRRDFKNLKNLIDETNVFYVDYGFSSNYLISKCDLIFTWSGTVAIQAIFQGKTAITICHPYYLSMSKFIQLNDVNDLDLFFNKNFENIENLESIKNIFSKKILSSLFDGYVYSHNNNPKSAETCVNSLLKMKLI